MRSIVPALLAALLAAGGAKTEQSSAAAPWSTWESGRSAIGCSTATSDDYWTCLVVRCDDDGSLALYYDFTESGPSGPFAITVDGARFAVVPEAPPASVHYPKRLTGDVAAIAAALRGGGSARIVDIDPPLNPGFDIIPLRGSGRAIGQVVAACTAKGGATATGELLRDAAGRVSISGLTDQADCAKASGSGTVEEVARNPKNGQIESFWFANDTYGREFINVEWLPPGKDFEARSATLSYLLTPGRRLDVDVLGCGAAASIQELVAATEKP